jgi:hypothetical protein
MAGFNQLSKKNKKKNEKKEKKMHQKCIKNESLVDYDMT